jgi:hypothetical protein
MTHSENKSSQTRASISANRKMGELLDKANGTTSAGMKKDTSISRESTLRKHARAVVSTGESDYYHPLMEEATLMLPTRYREINQFCRHFYRVNSLVHSAINFHSEFAINGFTNVCEDKVIKKYFDELAFDKLKLPDFLSFIGLEYYKLANVLPFGVWNEGEGRWERFITLNPDYVEIEKTLFSPEPILKLDPDEGLKRIVQNKKPEHLYRQLDPAIIAFINKGQKIPLSDLIIETEDGEIEFPQCTHIARKSSQYEVYGTPMIMAGLKTLIYEDILIRAQFAIAKRHWKPIKLVKVGDENHEPTADILDAVEEALKYADADSNAFLVWHHYINVEYIASAGHILPLNAEYDNVDKKLMRALEISDAVLTNQGMTFANASISLRVMVNKYLRFQKMLSEWIKNFIYKPVAQVQGFYRSNEEGKQELVIPDIEWELTRLQDDAQLKTVYSGLQQKGLMSKHTLMANIGLDYEKEKKLMQQEKQDDLIFQGAQPPTPPGKAPSGAGPGAPPTPPPPGGGGGAGAGVPTGIPPATPGGAGEPVTPPEGGPGMGAGPGAASPPM